MIIENNYDCAAREVHGRNGSRESMQNDCPIQKRPVAQSGNDSINAPVKGVERHWALFLPNSEQTQKKLLLDYDTVRIINLMGYYFIVYPGTTTVPS